MAKRYGGMRAPSVSNVGTILGAVGSSALTHGNSASVREPALSFWKKKCAGHASSSLFRPCSFLVLSLSTRLPLSLLAAHFAPSRTSPPLQHLRHSYASRNAAPHLFTMLLLHLNALHAAASILRIMQHGMLASLPASPRTSSCRCKLCSAPLAAAILAYGLFFQTTST